MFETIKKIQDCKFVNNARDFVVLDFVDKNDFLQRVEVPTNSPNWEKLLKLISFKEIEVNTHKEINKQKRFNEAEAKKRKADEKRFQIEQLHNIKQELYNIPAVKATTNKKFKKELRVAETPERARLIASMILIDYVFELGEPDLQRLKEINKVEDVDNLALGN